MFNKQRGLQTYYDTPQAQAQNNHIINPEPVNPPEIYYRTMSAADYDYLRMTGELPASGETCISPAVSFSRGYNGITVKFELNNGTTSMLEQIGLSNGHRAMLAKQLYPDMPYVANIKWTEDFAYFKAEGAQINIGLGKGRALETFNRNIIGFEKVD